MHKTRHFALDLEKDIRLSMTAGSKSDTGLFRAGYPRRVTRFSSDAVRIAKNLTFPAFPLTRRPSGGLLVELIGIEPTTSGLQSPRSPS